MRVILIFCLLIACAAAEGKPAVVAGPDPLQWDAEPHARVSYAATMAAERVAAPGGVEYRFTAGGFDSGWQESNECKAEGLKPETAYTFTASVRERGSGRELRAPSRPVTVTTRKADRFDRILADEIEVVPLQVTGNRNNRINIVAINRWTPPGGATAYNKAALRDEFVEDARAILRGFAPGHEDAVVPVANYRDFFNIYAVWWPTIPPWDPQKYGKGEDVAHWEVYNEVRARLFLPWQRGETGWVTHLAMVNSNGGGGGAGRILEERVGDAMIAGNALSPFIHEFAHTALCIGDEYTSAGTWGAGKRNSAMERNNCFPDYRREMVPWRAWVDPKTPVPTPYLPEYMGRPGVFEGGVSRLVGYYRCLGRGCLMGAGSFFAGADALCPIDRQIAVERIYTLVNPIEECRPARDEVVLQEPGTLRFSVKRIKPRPDTQKTRWTLNGKVIAAGTDQVDVTFGPLREYELLFSLTDETDMVRPDPPYAERPRAERRWRIVNPKPSSTAPPLRLSLRGTSPGPFRPDSGAVSATVTGGKPPYTYLWSTGAGARELRGLTAHTYGLRVVDSEFRHADAECKLTAPRLITHQVRSTWAGGKWRLSVALAGAEPGSVTCRWSNGATGLQVAGLADGTCRYTLTHRGGAKETGQVTLARPKEMLALATSEVVPSSDEHNGEIGLRVSGGRTPYSFVWTGAPEERGPERLFLPQGDYSVQVSDANRTTIERVVTIPFQPRFTLSGVRFEAAGPDRVRVANPDARFGYLWYDQDRPGYVLLPPLGNFTGTFRAPDGRVFTADALVRPATSGESIGKPRDRRAWAYLRAWITGPTGAPTWFSFDTSMKTGKEQALTIADTCRECEGKGEIRDGTLTLEVTGPEAGRFTLRYTGRYENVGRPLHAGTEFRPPASGNYYVAAQDVATGAISANRVGVAVTMEPAPRVEAGPDGVLAVKDPRPGVEYVWYSAPEGGAPLAAGRSYRPSAGRRCWVAARRTAPFPETALRPDQVKSAKLLLWLDAADVDGDGVEDTDLPRRGAVQGWKGRANGLGWGEGDFIFYQPNAQNGRPTASWETIWLQGLAKPLPGVQTLLMAYRDHPMSTPGTGPWEGKPFCLWDLSGKPEAEKVPAEFRRGRVTLDGAPVDPYATPAPTRFCVAGFEYDAPLPGAIQRTDTHWEGAVGEMVAYAGKLSDEEKRGVEEYLRRKWLSAAHLESPRAVSP